MQGSLNLFGTIVLLTAIPMILVLFRAVATEARG